VVTLSYDCRQLRLSASKLIFTPDNWATPQTVTVTAIDDRLCEGQTVSSITHSVTSSADSSYFDACRRQLSATLDVTVADNDVAGVLVLESFGHTLVAPGSVPVSDTYIVRLTMAPKAGQTVTIATRNDGLTTQSALVPFDATNWWLPQVVTVSAVDNPAPELVHPGIKQFAVQQNQLSDIRGPLEIKSDFCSPMPPLFEAVMLPGELNPRTLVHSHSGQGPDDVHGNKYSQCCPCGECDGSCESTPPTTPCVKSGLTFTLVAPNGTRISQSTKADSFATDNLAVLVGKYLGCGTKPQTMDAKRSNPVALQGWSFVVEWR